MRTQRACLAMVASHVLRFCGQARVTQRQDLEHRQFAHFSQELSGLFALQALLSSTGGVDVMPLLQEADNAAQRASPQARLDGLWQGLHLADILCGHSVEQLAEFLDQNGRLIHSLLETIRTQPALNSSSSHPVPR